MPDFAAAPILAHVSSGAFALQTQDAVQWLFVLGSFLLLGGQLTVLARAGRRLGARGLTQSISKGAERWLGLPAWSALGVVLTMWALATAFLGFMWDVAWHADLGRDRELFTVPHTLIIVGLAGMGIAGLVSTIAATRSGTAVGYRVLRLRIPAGAAALFAVSIAGMIAFPLDDLWHATYGVDVTMWSPTHLVMIGGASLSPLALLLLIWEAPRIVTRARAWVHTVILGSVLVGLSTVQLEFDMGIPQWQALYHPVLIAFAAGFTLVLARTLLGRWGAMRAVLAFLVMRGAISLVIGPLLGRTLPHFPLYVIEAACVESAFILVRTPLRRALVSGLLVGTAGIAAEWAWMAVWGTQPWQPAMLPMLWVAALMTVAAAFAAMAMATRVTHDAAAQLLRPRWLGTAGVVAVLALLAIPAPRNAAGATATITQWPVTQPATTVDSQGQTVTTHDVMVTVQLTPRDAATGADWFRVEAWQGGGVVNIPLLQTSPGTYATARSVPVGGNWKAIVFLARGATLAAAPITEPAEPDQALAAIPLVSERTAPLASAQDLLMRESHGGSPWIAVIAYSVFVATVLAWILVIAAGAARIARERGRAPRGPSVRSRALPLHVRHPQSP